MQKLNYYDTANWDQYLPGALFAYCLSKHHVTGYSPFAMLYGRKATTLLLLGPLLSSDKSMNSDAHIKNLVNCIIDIQATAYTSAYKTKMLELSPDNARRFPLPEFNVDIMSYTNTVFQGAVQKQNVKC
ncbi:hypothetical protein DSO57_1008802 [Entomophthora muscae]|uniref:Uncharacterized protein n=1 Tax=Entomophthora muscae TaxID=34485 RepID=A0ACC2US19_9FUNG|nr:hypothetical protein DSO57_1008802 [Entomophthora muscae]